MTEQEVLIDVVGLNGGYGDQEVLRDVTLSVYKSEVLVIAGRSGCGKSTLMRYLLGLAEPWAGKVFFEGGNLWGKGRGVLKEARSRWGVLFQSGALLGSLTILENVALPLSEYTSLTKDEMSLLCLRKLELVGMADFADCYPLEVSGGMQKRAGLARAMVMDPDVLFFDEPSAGLDPVTSVELDDLICSINHTFGTTMVIVTHDLPSIFAISDRVVMLDERMKGIIAVGSAESLLENSKDSRVRMFFSRKGSNVRKENRNVS